MADEPAPPPPAFDAPALARTLLRTVRAGALATLDARTGAPFSSLVSVATDVDGSPVMLTSGLSAHTRNLDADGRASLLLAASGKGDPLVHPRLTVSGVMERSDEPRLRRRFLARHPKARLYVDFPDFGFRRLRIEAAHLNGGFARAAALHAADLLTDLTGADAMVAAEEGALAHLNADHAEAVRLYATRLAGRPDRRWVATGLDPDGIDLTAGDLTARVAFLARVLSEAALRRALVDLAAQARAAPAS